MEQLLIIDDDVKLCAMLRDFFASHGFRLVAAHQGHAGLEAARAGDYQLVLLDVTMPGMDGFSVLERLRATSDSFVVLLTGRGELADRVRGLALGADDYLAKPFHPEELVARVRAVLRRGPRQRQAADSARKERSTLRRGPFLIDFASRTASCAGVWLDLTNVELSLLKELLESPGLVLSRDALAERVFERPLHPLDRSLDMHISRLRRKIEAAAPGLDLIKTIRGSGYLFSHGKAKPAGSPQAGGA